MVTSFEQDVIHDIIYISDSTDSEKILPLYADNLLSEPLASKYSVGDEYTGEVEFFAEMDSDNKFLYYLKPRDEAASYIEVIL